MSTEQTPERGRRRDPVERRPPRSAEWLLARCLPPGGVRETALGDLAEAFAERAGGGGSRDERRARARYWKEATLVGASYLARRLRREPMPSLEGAPVIEGRGMTMSDWGRDLRFAVKALARAPWFTVMALMTLGIGVGANAAVFSVVKAVYLRPLDFHEPDRLVAIGQSALDGRWSMSTHTPGTWADWSAGQRGFEQFAGYRYWTTTVEIDDVARPITTVHSLGSIFDVLGVPAELGRTFGAAEEGPGPERLVVLGHAFWTRELGGRDPVGRTLTIGGEPHEIIGVMPETFRFPTPDVDVWKTSDLSVSDLADRDDHFVRTIARLPADGSVAQAAEEMAAVHARIREAHPDQLENTTAEVVPLRDALLGAVGPLWLTLFGAVGFVLMISCANLANLMISRSMARRSELALRRALGASRARVARLVLTESVVLSVAGTALGVTFGAAMLRAILAWMPGGVPRAEVVSIDAGVVAFTLAASAAAALIAGLPPALRVPDRSLGAHVGSRASGGAWLRGGLMAGEVAVALVLVVGAGLATRAFAHLTAVDPGFATEGRAVFHVAVPDGATDAARDAFYRALEERLAAGAGVESVGVTSVFPLSGFTPGAWVGQPGVPVPRGDDNPTLKYVGISPGFRQAAGLTLLAGRDLGPDDGRTGTPAILLSESAARLLYPAGDALGSRLYLGPDEIVAPVSTVVGIVADVRQTGMTAPPTPMAYVPRGDIAFWRGFDVVVRSAPGVAGLHALVRDAAEELDPAAVVLSPTSSGDFVAASTTGQRNVMMLFGVMAAIALVMAIVGVFGVASFWAQRRIPEIGVRIALGAPVGSVRTLVLREGMAPVTLGVVAGLATAMGLSRFMTGLIAGVDPLDPATFATVAAVLGAAALTAIWIPASRASRTDPVRALVDRSG